jgi:hypothetical protein
MSSGPRDVTQFDPYEIDKQYNLRFDFYSSTNPSIKYTGYIDTILDFGVRVRVLDTCATGHNISFAIFKDKRVLMEGTAKIDSLDIEAGSQELKHIVCTFNQFSESSKKLLLQEAELNQDEINDYMDELD